MYLFTVSIFWTGWEQDTTNRRAKFNKGNVWKVFHHQVSSFLLTVLFTNMQTLKFKRRLHNCVFLLPSIIIMITSNEPWNTETHKTDGNPPITNHKPWPFEPIKVNFCFLRGPLRWLKRSNVLSRNVLILAANIFRLQNALCKIHPNVTIDATLVSPLVSLIV